jgi:hypothetical protein
MSKQAIAQFLSQLAADEQLRTDLVAFAANHGFDFREDELAEAELEKVAGGVIGDIGLKMPSPEELSLKNPIGQAGIIGDFGQLAPRTPDAYATDPLNPLRRPPR